LDLEQICKKDQEVYLFFQKFGEPGILVNIWKDGSFSDLFHYEDGQIASFYSDGASRYFLPNAHGKNSLMYRNPDKIT
jgi:hypothetical protein